VGDEAPEMHCGNAGRYFATHHKIVLQTPTGREWPPGERARSGTPARDQPTSDKEKPAAESLSAAGFYQAKALA